MNEWTERYIDVPMAKQMDMKGKWIDKWLSGWIEEWLDNSKIMIYRYMSFNTDTLGGILLGQVKLREAKFSQGSPTMKL